MSFFCFFFDLSLAENKWNVFLPLHFCSENENQDLQILIKTI